MNLKTGFITISIVAFSPFVFAQDKVFNDFINDSNAISIAENRSGTSTERAVQQHGSKSMQIDGMLEAYENKSMDINMEGVMDDKIEHKRIHHKRA
ncbi:hypothetical protein [Vibrio neonatus]|uniref:hypothetical protein n=1 Tax=Vibrio neonatus TaxID=278860 RepID=UPI0021C38FDE|nr:hypothetical protein [Vibrio neonatus]